jgi:lysophospholipase L1-like esterase
VHYGSSISHCTDAETPDRTWPQQVADGQGWRLRNLGLAGSAQLDAAVARVIGDLPADLITLKVGINVTNADSMRVRAYRPALEGFLDTIRERRPETPIVLISAIACPAQESSPGPIVFTPNGFAAARRDVQDDSDALTLRETRAIAAAVVERRRSSDPRIAYLDGRELLAEAEAALLPDGLHPGQQGMDLIAERFRRLVPPLLHRMR